MYILILLPRCLTAYAALAALVALAALIEGDESLFVIGQIVMAFRWKGRNSGPFTHR